MSGQKRKQPSGSKSLASSSMNSKESTPLPTKTKNIQRRKGLTVNQTLELGKSLNQFTDSPEDLFIIEKMCSVGLVASQPLFDLPKGFIKEGNVDSYPVATFGDYYGILDYIKNAKIMPFLYSETHYMELLLPFANNNDFASFCLALSSGQIINREVYDQLVSACQILSKDVVIGLFDQIEFKKVTCGFSLIQTPDADHSSKVQETFYSRSDVLCISLHRTSSGSTPGSLGEVGSGDGKGKNINCPMPIDDFDSNNLLYAFHHLVMPVALEFQPNVVIVTTSLDFHLARDSKAQVTPEAYANMIYTLLSLAQGKVAIIIECDHTLQYVAPSVYAMTEVLLGLPPKAPLSPVFPTQTGANAVASAIKTHAPYWESLAFHKSSSNSVPMEEE